MAKKAKSRTRTDQYLLKAAKKSIEANIVKLRTGKSFIRAGKHQFAGFWTRDFAYSIPALLIMKRYDVVKSHLSRILDHLREKDFVLPRNLDNFTVTDRYLGEFLWRRPKARPKEPLKTYYLGEWDTPAFDSNILVIRGALLYMDATRDSAWWVKYERKLIKAYRFYEKQKNSKGFILQPKHSDWQDTVKREGLAFLTNFLYWDVSRRLLKFPVFKVNEKKLDSFRKRLFDKFLDPERKILRTVSHSKVAAVDGNLFALSIKEFWDTKAKRNQLYRALKKDPLWKKYAIPGFVAYPEYPRHWKADRFMDLGPGLDYHDNMFWSWLIGFSIKVAKEMGDKKEATRISRQLEKMMRRDKGIVYEVYSTSKGQPFLHTKGLEVVGFRVLRGYISEYPFSWGASFIVDAAF